MSGSSTSFVDNNIIDVLQVAYQVFSDEIDGISSVANALDHNFLSSIKVLLNCTGKVVVSGIGKSGHIARKVAATFASTGTPAFFVHPAEALHGDLGMIESRDVVIAISYSGESDELLTIMPALKRKKVPVIVITGTLNSSLAKVANYVLNTKIEKEACPLNLAPTTSTTASLVMGDALAISLLKLRGLKSEDFALSHPGGILGRRLLISVADIMHIQDEIPVVMLNSNIKEVVFEISKKSLGFTAVLEDDCTLAGIITDGDVRRVLDHDISVWDSYFAKDIMNQNPKTIREDSLAVHAIDLMTQYKISGFLVVDNNNALVGAFNLHDLFRAKLI